MTDSAAAGEGTPEGTVQRFERLYRDNFPFVWAAARRCGAPVEAVDDVVQDVFVTAYRRAEQLDWEVSLRGWLYGVTRRVAFRYRRSAARTARRRGAVAVVAKRSSEPHRRQEAADALEAMLDRIDEDQREVFVMTEMLGMTAPEIAAELGIPINTVYSRLRLARKRLQSVVGSERALEEGIEAAREIEAPDRRDEDRNFAVLVPLIGARWPVIVAAASRLPMLAVGVAVAAIVGVVAVGSGGSEPAAIAVAPAAANAPRTNAPASSASAPAPVAPASIANAPASIAPAPASSAPPIGPAPRPPAPAARPSAPLPAPPAVAPSVSSLEAEVALIDAAQAHLQRGDTAAALATLDEHARRFPTGQLAEVRSATRIRSLCRAGRTSEAETTIAALHRDFPGSNVARQVGRKCPDS